MLFKLAVHLIKFDRLHNKRGIPDSINPHSFIPLTGKQWRGKDMSPQHEEFQRNKLTSRANSFHVKVFMLIQRLLFLISWSLVLTAKKNLSVFLNILSSFLNVVQFNSYDSESIYTVPQKELCHHDQQIPQDSIWSINDNVRLYNDLINGFKISL